MTIELSSHVLSFNKKLFLSVISLFIAFAICFMAFQYRREKEYKIELLNTQLQNYNDRLNDFLRGRDTLNIQQLDDYVCEHTFEDLRVPLINKNGTVIYDNLGNRKIINKDIFGNTVIENNKGYKKTIKTD